MREDIFCEIMYVNYYCVAMEILMQARSVSTIECMGRRTFICNSMSHTSWPNLCLQIQHHWTRGDSFLACSCLVAPCNCVWSTYYQTKIWKLLSISISLRRISDLTRYQLLTFFSV